MTHNDAPALFIGMVIFLLWAVIESIGSARRDGCDRWHRFTQSEKDLILLGLEITKVSDNARLLPTTRIDIAAQKKLIDELTPRSQSIEFDKSGPVSRD